MKRTILKSLIILIAIPLINSIGFGIGTLFHDIVQSTPSTEQFSRYENVMMILMTISGISILLIERIFDTGKIDNLIAIITYSAVFILIGILTWDQFVYRPFEHTLTYLSIISILGVRELLNRSYFRSKKDTDNLAY